MSAWHGQAGRRQHLLRGPWAGPQPRRQARLVPGNAGVGGGRDRHEHRSRAERHHQESREQIAESYGARPSEVVFTSGGTEADNLAVKGLYWVRHSASPRRRKVLITAIEHHAVLDSAQWLASHEAAEVRWLPLEDAPRLLAYKGEREMAERARSALGEAL